MLKSYRGYFIASLVYAAILYLEWRYRDFGDILMLTATIFGIFGIHILYLINNYMKVV